MSSFLEAFLRLLKPVPYIVLLGDVGTGKSTIVEKLTGATGRSSAASESVTLTSEAFESFDGSLIICDTPGSNAMNDQFQHNLHIAHAMNFHPVTCVMIIAKAETRMDNVVKNIREYAEGFLPEDLPADLLGVCVTHMDSVTWDKSKLLPHLKNLLGIDSAVFSSLGTTPEALSRDIQAECRKKRAIELHINGEMFLKLFKINSGGLKVLRESRKEVGRFEKMKQDFYRQKKGFPDIDQMNMTFEFQTWVANEIIAAQMRLSENNGFSFIDGPNMASEAGHVANMTAQLRKVLSDVRIEAAKYHKDVDTTFRRCPHCGEVWQKIHGCNGATTCGSRPSYPKDDWSEMSTFAFKWDSSNEQLIISKLGGKVRKSMPVKESKQAGCGRNIEWSKMAPVSAPVDYDINPSSTEDVKPLPSPQSKSWNESYDKAIGKLKKLKINQAK